MVGLELQALKFELRKVKVVEKVVERPVRPLLAPGVKFPGPALGKPAYR